MDDNDSKILARYRQASQEEPAEKLDKAILALAEKTANTSESSLTEPNHEPHEPHKLSPFNHPWSTSLSLAATLLLTIGLVTFMQREVPEQFHGEKAINSEMAAPSRPISEQEDIAVLTEENIFNLSKPTQAKSNENQVPSTLMESVLTQATAKDQQTSKNHMLKKEIHRDTIAPLILPRSEATKENFGSLLSDQIFDEILPPKKTFPITQPAIKRQKANKASCSTDSQLLSAQTYWYYFLTNAIATTQSTDSSLCIGVNTKYGTTHYHIARKTILDPTQKQRAYIQIIEQTITKLDQAAINDKTIPSLIQLLQKITNQPLSNKNDWLHWWRLTKPTAHLNIQQQYIQK